GPTLGQKLRYTSTEGDPIVIARGKLALHLFMHQLHHRGQLTTLLSQLGIDYGSTDMPLIVPEALDSLCWSR
ncbi:MAG: DinB family protein, partial [Bradyrhizobium sp.]|nr:DinB family protein [Bradyrhizobium sp.]